jgi:DNA-binding transcriptional MocR family regulator
VLEALGLKALELPTDAEHGVDLTALARALDGKSVSACLFASSFNNPLGCTMPDTRKLELLQLLTKHRVTLIEDDIFGDIYFGAERPKPFGALEPRRTRSIAARSRRRSPPAIASVGSLPGVTGKPFCYRNWPRPSPRRH